jgi:alpha,alpha-trehalase
MADAGATTTPLDSRKLDAVLFDMDGVVTRTASIHAAAWKQTFDTLLKSRSAAASSFLPFDIEVDYRRYVDGKPRLDGIVSFLASRGITLPHGEPGDGLADETVWGIGNRKDQLLQRLLKSRGVEVFETTVEFITSLKKAGLRIGVFSASRNAEQVLAAAEVLSLFDAKVDGVDADHLGLPGKPHPATLLELARRLGAEPGRCAVVEDSTAGVHAGRAGGFGVVIGVNRSSSQGALLEAGADVEVVDLGEVRLVSGTD